MRGTDSSISCLSIGFNNNYLADLRLLLRSLFVKIFDFKNDYDASLYFIVQRNDCMYFKPSNVDEFYYNALKKAHNNGVNIKAIKVDWTSDGDCLYKSFIDVIID